MIGSSPDDVLKIVGLGLPASVEFDSHFNTAVDHLLPTLEIDSQLDKVTIVDRERFGFGAWCA